MLDTYSNIQKAIVKFQLTFEELIYTLLKMFRIFLSDALNGILSGKIQVYFNELSSNGSYVAERRL